MRGSAIVIAFALAAGSVQGMAATPLCAPDTMEVSGAIRRDIAARLYPGAAYAVSIDGRTVLSGSSGERDIASGAPMRYDSIFRLASMSKPITATAIMLLVDQGKLTLDDPVSRFIPEFGQIGVGPYDPAGTARLPVTSKPITVRDLLTHTAGLDTDPHILDAEASDRNEARTLAKAVPLYARYPIAWEPGSRFRYSPQTGFDILSRIVEIVSGMSFDHFLDVHIFRPLGMVDTGFRLTQEQRKRLVSMYEAKQGVLLPSDASFASDTYFSGAAGLYGTVGDYLRFANMLAAGGIFDGSRILTQHAVEQMRAFQLSPGFPGLARGSGWGLAMRVVAQDPVLPIGSYGWSGAFGTHFWIDSTHRAAAVFMINLSNAGGADAPTARNYEKRAMGALSSCFRSR